MDWQIYIVALGLVLVLEGLMPFISPGRYRRFLKKMFDQSESVIRKMGLAMLIAGLVVIVFMQIFTGI